MTHKTHDITLLSNESSLIIYSSNYGIITQLLTLAHFVYKQSFLILSLGRGRGEGVSYNFKISFLINNLYKVNVLWENKNQFNDFVA